MSEITPREAIDPEGTLPNVQLVVHPDNPAVKGTLVPTKMRIMTEGETIGETTFVESRWKNHKEAWLNGIEISNPDYRGRGFGTAAYLAAIERAHENGETFRTHDWTQTEAAVKVWKRFIDAGIAEVIQPFKRLPSDELVQFKGESWIGHIQIPPSKANPTENGLDR